MAADRRPRPATHRRPDGHRPPLRGSFYADPNGWVLDDAIPVTNPNIFAFGKPGRGKSGTVKAFCLRMMDFGYRTLILGDPKDEYEKLCRALGVQPFAIGHGLGARINPLAFGPLAQGWADLPTAEAQRRAAIVFDAGSPSSAASSAPNASAMPTFPSAPPTKSSSRPPSRTSPATPPATPG